MNGWICEYVWTESIVKNLCFILLQSVIFAKPIHKPTQQKTRNMKIKITWAKQVNCDKTSGTLGNRLKAKETPCKYHTYSKVYSTLKNLSASLFVFSFLCLLNKVSFPVGLQIHGTVIITSRAPQLNPGFHWLFACLSAFFLFFRRHVYIKTLKVG